MESLFWFRLVWKGDKYNIIFDLGWKLFLAKCYLFDSKLNIPGAPHTHPVQQSIIFE